MTIGNPDIEGAKSNKDERESDHKSNRWVNLFRNEPDRVIELIFAAAIVIFAYLGWKNSQSSSYQTDQQIRAAEISAFSAKQSAQAARDFSNSARSINGEIADAVDRLNAQARATEEARESSVSSSDKALQTTIDNFHQEQRVWVGFGNDTFEIKQGIPLKCTTNVTILGKTPARQLMTNASFIARPTTYSIQLSDLTYKHPLFNNETVYPGAVIPLTQSGDTPINETEKMATEGIIAGTVTLYFYGMTTYEDVFHHSHWTHFCARVQQPHLEGGLCPIYNDSDGDEKATKTHH